MKLSVLMSSLAATVLFTATGAQAADTLAKIAESGKITLSYRESSVPFSYLDGPNKPIGMAVDLSNAVVEAVKKKLNKPNLQVALMPVTSQNRIPLITNGTVDLECGSTTNNTARGKDVAFAINHFYTGTRLLVKKSSKIKNYADLAKKTVASTTGTTNALVMRKYNTEKSLGMDIVLGKDHADSFLLVESDRAAAFAMDDILLYGLIANAKTPGDFEVVGDSLQVEPYACMLPKDDPAFKKLVDDTFAGMMKSGEFEKLYNKWFMQPIPPKNVPLNLPMSPQLKENLKALSDKPAT
ncbi:transporter substrate-binding domain-containing protein [Variovorax sp. NFACC27]|uniref:Transporter substrate-binding domain-containing protein n=1 Tax=Variovorax gossypii TaxID=1679495 RepID=A0A3S0J781_9BURK|nr:MULTISPECIES: transporter substrate-binding domain-containing protein [Variovorax]SEF33460.1 amino acid ABC transporter substrate-binding protein, PAAT family [Variovorax sp. NFACC28]SEG96425.1 amino acid ABC transporter substrate-binding protein, PAAT family [Variovorax sp. NFACC29]SFD84512.1 amino acid ABC transporter substrate-binding protein, PAAT family [Variovorax sp. NFACC26]SFG96136.1 amino acid ABC transporter substrate-binding protein, PAAT family [Variovorax sp. NFACC27]RTQ35405.